MALKYFDLERQFTFYASYHNNLANVLIHLVCIWPLLATFVLLLQYTPTLADTPTFLAELPLGQLIRFNGAFVASIIYMVCYVLMEPQVGGLGSLLIGSIYFVSGHLVQTQSTINGWELWKVTLAIHVVGWIIQFVGHGVFEGRAPALLDSLDQALLTAPLFVLLEVAFFWGYRPDLKRRIEKKVEENIAKFEKEKLRKKF